MEASTVEKKILDLVPDAQLEIDGADCDFNVVIVSESFDEMSQMKRQQWVLSGFTDEQASGALHALTVKLYTLSEWNNKSSHLVQLSL